MMRKNIAMVVLGAMLFGLVSCGPTAEYESTAESDTQTNVPESTYDDNGEDEEPADSSTEAQNYDYSSFFDDNGYFVGVKASEIVTLPQYKGVSIDKSVVTVDKSEVTEQLDYYASMNSLYTKAQDREIVDGDTVNIDYVGSIDGVEFSGGSTEGRGTYVTIGVTDYIDDFLDQLIGHAPGETVNVEVTFPDNYHATELQGKDALFVTKINFVCGGIDEDGMAEKFGMDSYDTLVSVIEQELYYSQVSDYISLLLGQATCEYIPEIAIDYAVETQMDYLEYQYSAYGSVESILLAMGYESVEAFVEANRSSYEKAATFYLAFQAIAELEGITVTDDDLEKEGITQDDIDTYGKSYFKQNVMMNSVIPDFIVTNAVITEG